MSYDLKDSPQNRESSCPPCQGMRIPSVLKTSVLTDYRKGQQGEEGQLKIRSTAITVAPISVSRGPSSCCSRSVEQRPPLQSVATQGPERAGRRTESRVGRSSLLPGGSFGLRQTWLHILHLLPCTWFLGTPHRLSETQSFQL